MCERHVQHLDGDVQARESFNRLPIIVSAMVKTPSDLHVIYVPLPETKLKVI